MYFKYAWLAGATATNVLADLVATICSVNPTTTSLSAGCDKANSSLITNSTVTNWVVYDAAASTTSQVLRSLNADGITYKYIQINVTATVIYIQGWESWNAVTHVGTNSSTCNLTATTNSSFTIGLSVAGNISLIATPKLLVFINSPLVNSANIFLSEFSRDSVLLDNNYPCIIVANNTSKLIRNTFSEIANISICRVKNPVAAGDNIGVSISYPVMLNNLLGANNNSFAQATGVLGIDGLYHLLTMPIQLGYVVNSLQSKLGTVYDLLVIPSNGITYTSLDEVVVDGITYIMLSSGNTSTLLIPKT